MKDFNLSREQAAGIMGNLGHESGGLVAGMQEKRPLSGRGGLGWAQWTGPRRNNFEKWSAENGFRTNDPEGNYRFLKHELSTSHKSSIDALRKARTPEEAMYSFENNFERAGIKHYNSRLNYMKQALDAHDEYEKSRQRQDLPPNLKIPDAATKVADTSSKSTEQPKSTDTTRCPPGTRCGDSQVPTQVAQALDKQKLPTAPTTAAIPQPKLTTEPISPNKLDLTDPQKLGPPQTAPEPSPQYTYRGGETSTETPSAKIFRSPEVAKMMKEAKEVLKKKFQLKTSNARVLQKELSAAKTEITDLKRKLKKCEPMDEEHVQSALTHIHTRSYLKRFPEYKKDLKQQNQLIRAIRLKGDTAMHYDPHKMVPGQAAEKKKPKG